MEESLSFQFCVIVNPPRSLLLAPTPGAALPVTQSVHIFNCPNFALFLVIIGVILGEQRRRLFLTVPSIRKA